MRGKKKKTVLRTTEGFDKIQQRPGNRWSSTQERNLGSSGVCTYTPRRSSHTRKPGWLIRLKKDRKNLGKRTICTDAFQEIRLSPRGNIDHPSSDQSLPFYLPFKALHVDTMHILGCIYTDLTKAKLSCQVFDREEGRGRTAERRRKTRQSLSFIFVPALSPFLPSFLPHTHRRKEVREASRGPRRETSRSAEKSPPLHRDQSICKRRKA